MQVQLGIIFIMYVARSSACRSRDTPHFHIMFPIIEVELFERQMEHHLREDCLGRAKSHGHGE